jgi:hypothetical protein
MQRRKATEADTRNDELALSPKQLLAVDLLATGVSVTAAAEACAISRQTASEWTNRHHAFKAALNRRRQELWAESVDRARALVPKALDVLADELDGEKRLAAAIHIVKAVGMYGLPPPSGPVDPMEFEVQEKERRFGLLMRPGFG